MEKYTLHTKTVLSPIFAGICIGLGGLVYLSCNNTHLGSFLFSIGLLSVLIFKLDLFTGKVCDVDYLKKPYRLLHILIWNVIGAATIGTLMRGRGIGYITAAELVEKKLAKVSTDVFIDAIICGICIAIAVKGYKKAVSDIDKCIIVILSVMCFIISGSEHVIADTFYFAIAGSNRIFDILIFMSIVTIGNAVGGMLISTIN